MSQRRSADAAPAPPGDAAFDPIAGSYRDLLDANLASTGESSEYFARGRIEWLARRARPLGVRPERVLDFGCGTGSAAPFLFETFEPTSLLGVDVSAASIEVARREHGSERARFLPASGYEPVAEHDLAYCNGVFHHIPLADRPAAARSVFDSLRPGGLFGLWENNPWNPGTRYLMWNCTFDHDAIPVWPRTARRLLAGAGFEVLSTDFLFIFPKALAALRALEPLVSRLPLGGQYQVLARRP